MRRLSALATLACALLLALAPAASALSPHGVRVRLAHAMRAAGPSAGAYVLDLDTGRRIYGRRAGRDRIPASINKLWITATALRRWGPDATFDTSVYADDALDVDGVLRGNLYLRGSGDPTLTDDRLLRLAADLRDQGLRRVRGRVYGDESLFDTRRGSYSGGWALDSEVTGELGALVVGRGYTKHGFQGRPALYAAQRLVRALRSQHIRVRGAGARTTPDDATELARSSSAPLAQVLEWMDQPSDNYYAEMLIKGLGADFGGEGSTTAGAQVVEHDMAELGLTPHVVDGSGLSRADRTSPREVVGVLSALAGDPDFVDALAVAGRSGTLQDRMRGTVAEGRCHGKTGTLHDVSNLAGICTTAGGDRVAFAFLMNGVTSIWSAHVLQDRMAEAIAALR